MDLSCLHDRLLTFGPHFQAERPEAQRQHMRERTGVAVIQETERMSVRARRRLYVHDAFENGVQGWRRYRHKLTPKCRKGCAFVVMQPLMMMNPGLRRLLWG